VSEQRQTDMTPTAGVTEEPSILSGSALPAGLPAVLRGGDVAVVVVANSTGSLGAPRALGGRVEVEQPLCLFL